ncbi:MAG: hypothetical protein AB7L17_10690 [Ilumatobacteraceae bacterium]
MDVDGWAGEQVAWIVGVLILVLIVSLIGGVLGGIARAFKWLAPNYSKRMTDRGPNKAETTVMIGLVIGVSVAVLGVLSALW